MPIVSVVIPTYKRAPFLSRAVRTALSQTMTEIEVLVVIDGPDDDASLEALSLFSDPRLRYVVQAIKRGASEARNTGAALSVGIWVAFLDDDDEWHPRKLEKQLGQKPDPANCISMTLSTVVGGHSKVVMPAQPYDNKEPFDRWLFDRKSWFGGRESWIQTSSLMIPRALFERLRFAPNQHEEWEFMICAVKQLGYRVVTVSETLVTFYVGRVYPWQRSITWIEKMDGIVDPVAYSGFLLNIVPQGLPLEGRSHALARLLRQAIRRGRPTMRQVFAFGLIWTLPHSLRQRLRGLLVMGRR